METSFVISYFKLVEIIYVSTCKTGLVSHVVYIFKPYQSSLSLFYIFSFLFKCYLHFLLLITYLTQTIKLINLLYSTLYKMEILLLRRRLTKTLSTFFGVNVTFSTGNTKRSLCIYCTWRLHLLGPANGSHFSR